MELAVKDFLIELALLKVNVCLVNFGKKKSASKPLKT